ncbi:hypothetical protein M378DRAFT_794317 [Amanita muscaria Koide BX008]|uniref:Uncharacterized protein n=1 Tax=Amanita muscaria (strain Koide BX008) TaxID=946122 RepID=A0A0C2WZY2_AMAMK|nr:hypothetical protein M378DRAFT_794317 [Amanita muscaria Koide BX008]
MASTYVGPSPKTSGSIVGTVQACLDMYTDFPPLSPRLFNCLDSFGQCIDMEPSSIHYRQAWRHRQYCSTGLNFT